MFYCVIKDPEKHPKEGSIYVADTSRSQSIKGWRWSSAFKHLPSMHEALGSAACSEKRLLKLMLEDIFLRNDQLLWMEYLNVKFKK